jgi:MFS family permease
MMGLVSLCTDASSEMIFPLMPIFLTGLAPGAAALYLGLMEGVAETTASILKLLSGRLSDALRKRKLLVAIGYGLSTICRPMMALAASGLAAVGLRFGDRIGKGVRTSPRDALIGDSVPADRRGLAFGFHRAMDHTGAILGALMAALFLFAMLGYTVFAPSAGDRQQASPEEMSALRWLFAVALIPGLAAMAFLILKVREIVPAKADEPTATAGPQRGAWRRLPRRYFLFVGIVTLFALGNSSDLFLLLHGRTRFGMGIAQVIGLWVVLHISKTLFSVPGGWLSDRWGRRPVLVAGYGLYALVYVGMAFVGAEWQFWALLVAYGLFHGLTEGTEKAVVADFVPSEHRGTAYGIYHGAIGLAALPASILFGVVWYGLNRIEPDLGPKVAFSIGAALAVVATVLLIALLSTSRAKAAGSGSADSTAP